MSAPRAFSPFRCWSIGRTPMAQPPGSDTRALPCRARSGPRTSTEALMVLTSSYVASTLFRSVVSIFTTLPFPSILAPSDSRTLIVVFISRRNGTLLISKFPGARMVATNIGRAAFFEPLTETSPLSFLPPFMISLSMLNPCYFCRGDACVALCRQMVNRARHASPLQQPAADNSFNLPRIFCGEYSRKSVFGEHFRYCCRLPGSDFQEQPPAGSQMIRGSRDDGPIEIKTVRTAVKSRSGFIIADFRLETFDISSRDVGRIADHKIEALSFYRLKERPKHELHADGVQRRIPPGQLKRLRCYIDRDHRCT